jgi:predicted membrane channel-forming protein YqfA (hemolysin III family)
MMIVVVARPYLCLLRYKTAAHTGVETKVKRQLSMFYLELANMFIHSTTYHEVQNDPEQR